MTDTGKTRLHYVLPEQAWYGETLDLDAGVDHELHLVADFPDGGPSAETFTRWYRLDGYPVARLELFHDGWAAFGAVPDFWEAITALGGHDGPTRGEVCDALETIGFVDGTPRVDPTAATVDKVEDRDPLREVLAVIADGAPNAVGLARAALAGRR